ncbi:MAG: hypothetical protein ACRDK4_08225 [Solirubrobacteraceae bacterium]
MGRRSRARSGHEKLSAPTSDYEDSQAGKLTLRGSLTPGARLEYKNVLAGGTATAAATREDSEQRALELLFERLAARWSIAGVVFDRPHELLARLRSASPGERAWVKQALREHCAEWFPDVRVP